jgi:hypothetical protein
LAFLVTIAVFSARSLKNKIACKELQVIAENEKEYGFKSQTNAELPYLHIALTGAATLRVGFCCITSFDLEIYTTVIFPVALHGCETWSLTLRKEHSLRVFENRVLRGIFGPNRVVDKTT